MQSGWNIEGTALKTVIARFSEVKKLGASGKFTGVDAEGEAIDINRIDTALKRVGISLKDYINGQKGLDSVFLELASKWDTLDMATQRYIATQAAGSRQQSRFLAMMSDYSRTMELVSAANNSAGASQEQFDKTLDSLESKLAQLKNAWDTFMMNLANNELIKGVIDVITTIINAMNGLVKAFKTAGSVLGDEFAGLFAMLGAGIVLSGAIGIGKQIVFGILKGVKSSWKSFEKTAVSDAGETGRRTGAEEARNHVIAYNEGTKGHRVDLKQTGNNIKTKTANTGKEITKFVKTPLGGVVAAAAAVALTTMLARFVVKKAFDSYDNTSEKISNLGEASKQAKEGLEQVNSEISSLASKKNDINDLVKEMGKLSTSSIEYSQKLYEVSKEMDAIRAKSPDIFNNAKNYDTIDGVQVLNDEGWAEYYNSLTKRQAELRNMELSATAEANRLKAREASENAGMRTKGITAKEEKNILGWTTGGAIGAGAIAGLLALALGPIGWGAAGIAALAAAGGAALGGGLSTLSANVGMDEAQMADVARFAQKEGFIAAGADEGKRNDFIAEAVRETGISFEELRKWIEKDAEAFDEHTRAIAASDAATLQSNRQLAASISSQLRSEGKSQGLDEWQTQALALRQAENSSFLRQQAEAMVGNAFKHWYSGTASSTDTKYAAGARDWYQKIADAYGYTFDPTNANKPLLDAQGQVVELTHLQLQVMATEIQYRELLNGATEGLYENFANLGLASKDLLLANYAFDKGLLDVSGYLGEVGASFSESLQAQIEWNKKIDKISFDEVSGRTYIKDFSGLEKDIVKAYLNASLQRDGSRSGQYIVGQDGSKIVNTVTYSDEKIREFLGEGMANLSRDDHSYYTRNSEGKKVYLTQTRLGELDIPAFKEALGYDTIAAENVVKIAKEWGFEKRTFEESSDFAEKFIKSFENYLRNSNLNPSNEEDYATGSNLYQIGRNIGAIDKGSWTTSISADSARIDFYNEVAALAVSSKEVRNSLTAMAASGNDLYSMYSVAAPELKEATKTLINSLHASGEDIRSASSLTVDAFESVVKSVHSIVDKIEESEDGIVAFSKEEVEKLTGFSDELADKFVMTGVDEFTYTGDLNEITSLLESEVDLLSQLVTDGYLSDADQKFMEKWVEGGLDVDKARGGYYTNEELKKLLYDGWTEVDKKINVENATLSKEAETLGITKTMLEALNNEETREAARAQINEILSSWTTKFLAGTSDEAYKRVAELAASIDGGGQSVLDQAYTSDVLKDEDVEKALNANLKKTTGLTEEADNLIKKYGTDYSKVIKALVLENAKAEGSFEKMADKAKDLEEALNSGDVDTYAKALNELTAYARKAFDYNENITTDFVDKNKKLFLDYANGVEGSAEKIQTALIDAAVAAGSTELSQLKDVKFDIYGTADFTEIFKSLQEVYGTAQETAEAIQGLGFSVSYERNENGEVVRATLQNSFAQGLGGIKGRTSKGSSSSWENSYDWLIDKLGQINKLLKERNDLERIHERMLAHDNVSAEDIRESLASRIANIRNVRTQQGEVYQDRINRLYSYAQDNKKYNKYAWVEDGEIRYDWNAINSIKSASTGEKVDKYISKLQEIRDLADEAKDSYEEQTDILYDIAKEAKQQYADMEQRIYDAIVSQAEKEIEELQNIDSSINDTNSKLLSDVQNLISEQRQMRENSEKEKELRDKQTKLNYMRMDTTGGNRTKILSLEKELAGEEQDYTDTLVDQKISELQKQNEEASYQRQQQIENMQAQLEVAKNNGSVAQRAEELLQSMVSEGGAETVKEFLKGQEAWNAMTKSAQAQWTSDFNNSLAQITLFLDGENGLPKLNEGIEAIVQVLREKEWTYTSVSNTYISGGSGGETGNPDIPNFTDSSTSPSNKISFNSAEVQMARQDKLEEGYTRNYNGYTYGYIEGKAGLYRGQSYAEIGITTQENWDDASKVSGPGDMIDVTHNKKKYKFLNGLYYGPFKAGGIADFTGPAWLDGTPTHPELILNARDTENFIQLRDVLADSGITNDTSKLGGDTYIQVEIQVDELASDYDVDQLVERVKHDISQDAQYRNSNTISLFR